METAGAEGGFSDILRRRTLQDFVVGFYNGTIKPNLAERDPASGRDIEFPMDGPEFERTKKSEVWSFSPAPGSGYKYKVIYKDRRFAGLEQLLGMYSGSVSTDQPKSRVEQSLYEVVMLLMKEGRLPESFKIQAPGDPRVDKLLATVEGLTQALEGLERRVKAIEDARASETRNEVTPAQSA